MHLNIPELLASSSLPTEAERVYLNQLLDTSNGEISRLTAAIDKLFLEREKLQSNVMAYKAILAPIRLLPEDMLREIFVSCLPSNKAAATAITEAPLLLGRICRTWRELALSTPELWASIHIQFSHQLVTTRRCEKAYAWIARSGTCPLTIAVTCHNDEDPAANEFFESLAELSKRWRSIDIAAPLISWVSSVASLSVADVPRLERFRHSVTNSLCQAEDREISETLWQSLAILGGKQLQDISLQNPWMRNSLSVISKVNFGQLTQLHLNGLRFTLMDAADILRRSPNLIGCALSIKIPRSTDVAWRFEPVALLHLTSFAIDVIPGYSSGISSVNVGFQAFFSSLELPQLTSFSPILGPYISWITLVRGSRIENLTLALSHLSHQSVLEYVRTSTYLKRLRFSTSLPWSPNDPRLGLEMDLFMAIDNANDVICPFLEVLELPSFGFSEETFVKLVKRRVALKNSEGKSRLKVVRANFDARDGIQLDVVSQLDELVTSGLSISVSYYRFRKPEDKVGYWPCRLPALDWPSLRSS
ncbi:hypothetical protein C8J56DRAFT_1161849 [Mycena floridula]|nr:hypothetical protein C8J56DRAFT_1161849 [Mycena floridula]